MDKLAQARGILDKLQEATNLTGIAAEKYFNKDFEKAMNQVRDSDDAIRSIMLGKKIGKSIGKPEDIEVLTPMKELLAEVKSGLSKREYIEAFSDLGKIHQQLMSISGIINSLNIEIQSVHEDLLLGGLKETDKLSTEEKARRAKRRKDLAALQKRLAAKKYDRFIKEAGLIDFFKNISTDRGRALMAWEKRYPAEVSKWRNGTETMLAAAKALYNQIIDQLKIAAKARAKRNLDNYLDSLSPLTAPIAAFDKSFRDYYNNAVKPLLAKLENDDPQAPAKTTEVTKELSNQEVVPDTVKSDTLSQAPTQVSFVNQLHQIDEPIEEENPATLRDEGLQQQMFDLRNKKSQHENFVKSLSKMGSEDPLVLKAMIHRYAKMIQATDFETSIKLFNIVKRIGK